MTHKASFRSEPPVADSVSEILKRVVNEADNLKGACKNGSIAGIITDDMYMKFDRHVEALQKFQYLGLTSLKDPEEICRKHFLDSLLFVLAGVGLNGKKVLDIGSGGGFPGLPLKIVYPGSEMVLVESNGKKAAFLEGLIERMDIRGIYVQNARIEELGHLKEWQESADVVLVRAVADTRILLELVMPVLKVGGKAFFWKSQKAVEELALAENCATELGAKLKVVDLPDIGIGVRNLVNATKLASTPKRFPRQYAQILKRPI